MSDARKVLAIHLARDDKAGRPWDELPALTKADYLRRADAVIMAQERGAEAAFTARAMKGTEACIEDNLCAIEETSPAVGAMVYELREQIKRLTGFARRNGAAS